MQYDDIINSIKYLISTRYILNFKRSKEMIEVTTASKTGGKPYFENEPNWPACKNCESPLLFILQINTTDFETFDKCKNGLYTFFHCSECPRNNISINYYQSPNVNKLNYAFEYIGKSPIKPCKINFVKFNSLPDLCSVDIYDESIYDEIKSQNYSKPEDLYLGVACTNLAITTEELTSGFSSQVYGYPKWLQYDEIPRCKICSEKMNLFLQLDSNKNVGTMFGDMGLIYVFNCKNHLDNFESILQCL